MSLLSAIPHRLPLLRTIVMLAGIGFAADRRSATLVALFIPFEFAGTALEALTLKALADSAVALDLRAAVIAAALLALTRWAWRVAGALGWSARQQLNERAGLLLQRRLAELTASIPTVEHFERPDYLRELDLVRQDGANLASMFGAVVQQASGIGRLLLTMGLLATLHPLLTLLPLFGLPSLFASVKAQRIRQRVNERVAELRRLETHLYTLAWASSNAAEVRVFGLQEELVARQERQRAAVDRVEDRGNLQITFVNTLGWLAFAAGFVGALVLIASEAAAGRATIGQVVLALALAAQVNSQVRVLAWTVTWALTSLKIASRYLWLTDYAARASQPPPHPRPAPDRLTHGISLENVSFVYPGTDRVALENVTLHLPAGATVAIVGENGAGKTTLVKLLCRLYEPTTGRILLDAGPSTRTAPSGTEPHEVPAGTGTDLRHIDVTDWRVRISAGFQDFARFMTLAGQSVGLGQVAYVDHHPTIHDALDRAHATDVVATLPRGLDTQLGRYFKDGIGLSGGQWQKLALGRAMMRPTPLLTVLDEPTAALDAPSEHALFERYAGAARRAASANGGITLLVSHRFSTVRMADLIVVMDNGRIVATGPHETLIHQPGLYAELYTLQARAYRP